MTDNEKLARWQGKCYHVSDWGQTNCKYCGRTNDPRYFDFDTINPDYLNNDTAAMSLLDTLVERGFDVRVQSFLEDPPSERWQCSLWQVPTEQNDSDGSCIVDIYRHTRREAVVEAVLELIEKEANSGGT